MSERGFTLPEMLVAMAIGIVVLFALVSLYLSTVKQSRLDEPLTYMQRQGTLILEKIGRQIRGSIAIKCSPATCDPITSDPLATCGVDPSLQVTDPAGNDVCFRLNAPNGNQLVQVEVPGGGQSNMLKESPATLTVSACPGVPMFSVLYPDNQPGCSPTTTPCTPPNRADICFQLRTTSTPPDSMIFRASFTKRN